MPERVLQDQVAYSPKEERLRTARTGSKHLVDEFVGDLLQLFTFS